MRFHSISRLMIMAVLLSLMFGCTRVLDAIGPDPHPLYVPESEKAATEAKRIELENAVNAKLEATTQGENIVAYLKRVADSWEVDPKPVDGHKERWNFVVDFRLIDFVKNIKSKHAKKLELQPLDNWFDAPLVAMAGKHDVWKAFVLEQVNNIKLSTVDSTMDDVDGVKSNRIFFSQHGKYYRSRENSSGISRVHAVSRFSFSEIDPAWFNRVMAAHKARAMKVHKQYTSIITRGWGDLIAMKDIIDLIINLDNSKYQKYASITENNTLKLPYDSSAVRILGVISSKRGSQGTSESLVRAQKGDTQTTLMVRVQIAKDGTPLFFEWFNMGN